METTFYARSKNAAGQKETVKHHLEQAAELCSAFLAPLGLSDVGEALGTFHDFGKYSLCFQEVLDGKRVHVNHALPGAALAFNIYRRQQQAAQLIAAVIAAHHSALDFGLVGDAQSLLSSEGLMLDAYGNTVSLPDLAAIRRAVSVFQAEMKPPHISSSLSADSGLDKMLCARFLLSALADADYSSSAEHFEPDYLAQHTGSGFSPKEAFQRLCSVREAKRGSSTAALALNRMRDELFDDCVAAAAKPPGVFTLTAPTGLGKTISLFAFAAKHCEIYGKRRVILILPYLAIAAQNIDVYRAAEPELLESHSAAVPDEKSRLLAERWAAPCIVTTNVGFFEPLFAAKPTECRHLHEIANSVIVLDEAQSLPPRLLQATLKTVNLLCEKYGCTVVFSTATQPSFQYLPGLQWNPSEIVPTPQRFFDAARRVTYDWRMDHRTPLSQIADEASKLPQVCIIVNLRKHARKLYKSLSQKTEGTFYLTSDLCHAHREAVLTEVKRRLDEGLPCRLVATQCIEAGVDLDFPAVYRALAPLESIVQAAGRCNRNGDGPDGKVVVFIPDEEQLYPGGGQDHYYENAAAQVLALNARHPIDCSKLSHIEEYYQLVYGNSAGDKPELQRAIDSEDFERVRKEYRLIPNAGVQVIVPYSGAANLFLEIREKADREGLTPALMRLAAPITVSTFASDIGERALPLYFRSPEQSEAGRTSWYLLCDSSCYAEDVGLHLDESFDGIL